MGSCQSRLCKNSKAAQKLGIVKYREPIFTGYIDINPTICPNVEKLDALFPLALCWLEFSQSEP